MAQWLRIGDHEVAHFGKRLVDFTFPGGVYQVSIDDTDQDYVSVQHGSEGSEWVIYLKEVRDRTFRLSGMTGVMPSLAVSGLWYELTLSTPSTIVYWGNQVVVRKDQEA